MSSKPTCTVIGGGVAGLSASVFLAKEGVKVTLLEASPKLGGRAYSFFDKTLNREIDNGQHLLASWYKNTFEYLRIIGSLHKLEFQESLQIDFVDINGSSYKLKCPKILPPMNLAYGLMSYSALDFSGKMAAVKFLRQITSKNLDLNELRSESASRLFERYKLPDSLINYFWKPFIVAVFNAKPEDTSAFMFVEMIKMGFVEKGNSVLVIPDDFLSEVLVNPAVNFLVNNDSDIHCSRSVRELRFDSSNLASIYTDDGTELRSDYYVSAVPFFDFGKLEGADADTADELKPSPILSIHFTFEKSIEPMFDKRFVGVFNASIQWIFKVRNDQLCIVISSAVKESEMDKEEIIEFAKNEMYKCIPAMKAVLITGQRVVKEMRATFLPDSNSLGHRPSQKTKFDNFYLAGDWTDTGLPATIESAVKSSKICTDMILKNLSIN